MRRILKYALYLIILLSVGIVSLGFYVKKALPNVGPPMEETVERNAGRIERGKYLANHVTVCVDCHSSRDWSMFSGPLVPGSIGAGGEVFDRGLGFPGVFISRNITPAGIGEMTDGQVIRAITCGVDRQNLPLFSIMPYLHYGKMDLEDVKAIVAYIRTLAPVESRLQNSQADFPMNFIIHTIPKKAEFVTRPPESDSVAYGAYVTNAASCMDCHTVMEKGEYRTDLAFAGGFEFPMRNGSVVRSSNITPDATGIQSWTEEQFVHRFKSMEGKRIPVSEGQFNTIMPWTMYGGMKESDLRAVYRYLRTVRPIENRVVKFTAGSNAH